MKKIFSLLFFSIFIISIFLGFSYMEDIDRNEVLISEYQIINEPQLEKNIRAVSETNFIINKNTDIDIINEIDDYVGWININNTPINYPVVRGLDNTFYLNRNYQKEYSVSGSIFMDRRNIGSGYDKHTLIYGHNMKNGSMFNSLNKYLDNDFFNDNRIIEFRNLYSTDLYEIISVYNISADGFEIPFVVDSETLQDFVSKSIYKTDYIVRDDEKILTLVTCNYEQSNGRMIVHAILK